MFILKKGHQPGVYVPLRAPFLVKNCFYIVLIIAQSLKFYKHPGHLKGRIRY